MTRRSWQIYVFGGKVIVPTMGKKSSGISVAIEPVVVVDLDVAALSKILEQRISEPANIVSGESDVILKHSGAKSRKKFEDGAQCWSVGEGEDEFGFGKLRRARQGWIVDMDAWKTVPCAKGVKEIAREIAGIVVTDAAK
jgi:hypothetical protein